MGYSGISLDGAKEIFEVRKNGFGSVPVDLVERKSIPRPDGDFDSVLAKETLNQIYELAADNDKDGSTWRAEFDCACAPIIHRTLELSAHVAGSSEFWLWFTFGNDGLGAELVDWRYGKTDKETLSPIPCSAREVYFGLERLKKGMFAKLWISANVMYVEGAAEPYDGFQVADVDLWDSHIIDVDFASVPNAARAFVKVIRDLKIERGDMSKPNEPAGFRDLAKEIRRRYATTAFEMLDERELYQWVKDVWEEREAWCGKS